MANDFDEYPLYDPIIRKDGMLSDIWKSFLSTDRQNLQGYLTQNGSILPNVTTTQRDNMGNLASGQSIYNTTLNTAQYYNGTMWVSYP